MIEEEEQLKGGTEMYWQEILSSILMWVSAICMGVALFFMNWLPRVVFTVLFSVSVIGLTIAIYLVSKDI